MFRSLVAKVMWVGRATVFMVGLSVMLALLFGIATTALAGNGPGGIFNLGQKNTVNRLTQLGGAPTSGAMLRLDNDGSGTALELKVGPPDRQPGRQDDAADDGGLPGEGHQPERGRARRF